MTLTTLVTGATAAMREAAIAREIAISPLSHSATALILEGLPDGKASPLQTLLPGLGTVARLSTGCICCLGRLPLQVNLNRILRQQPERLYISLSDATHCQQLREFLLQPAYRSHLQLTPDLHAQASSDEPKSLI